MYAEPESLNVESRSIPLASFPEGFYSAKKRGGVRKERREAEGREKGREESKERRNSYSK